MLSPALPRLAVLLGAFLGTVSSLVAQAPTNDECSGAIALAIGNNGPFDATGATTSVPALSCSASGAEDVWHAFTAVCTGQVSFETCGAAFDTVIELYDGSCGALNSLACNDDAPGACAPASSVRFRLTQGVTYYLRVGAASGSASGYSVLVSHSGSIGSFSSVATGCGAVTMAASGAPTVAGSLRYEMGGASGMPFLWFGLPVGPFALCPGTTCALGADIGVAGSSTLFQFTLPCDPTILGGVIGVQGADFQMSPGSCPAGEPFFFDFTNTIITQIG